MLSFLAPFLAAAAHMVLGFMWYSPMLFGTQWMKLMGYTANSLKKAQAEMGPKYAISMVASVVQAAALQWFIHQHRPMGAIGAMVIAAIAWLGFISTVQLTGWLFGGRVFKLFIIDTGYQLVGMILMSLVVFWVR